jgi:hypothetical protein
MNVQVTQDYLHSSRVVDQREASSGWNKSCLVPLMEERGLKLPDLT